MAHPAGRLQVLGDGSHPFSSKPGDKWDSGEAIAPKARVLNHQQSCTSTLQTYKK